MMKALAYLAAAGGAGLLAACEQGTPQTLVVTPKPSGGPAQGTAPGTGTAAPAAAGPGRPMYQMDAQHTGRSPYTGPRQMTLLRSFDTASFDTPNPGDPPAQRLNIESSAAIAPDGTIYLGNFRGNLFALRDPGSGDRLQLAWRFHPPGASSFHSTPALAKDGTVYIGFSTGGATPEAKGTFYALKAPASGIDPQVLWTVDLGPGRQTSSPTLGPDGTIYAVSGAGRLVALAPDGRVKWTVATGPAVKASPALGSDGTVYVPSVNGRLYAIAPPSGDGTEGTVKWTFDFGEHPGTTPFPTATPPPPGVDGKGSGASPTIGPDGTIYLGANNSNFYAIAPDGQLKWLYEAEREIGGIWSSAALSADNSTLFFGANKGGLYALKRDDGSLRWQTPIYGSIYTSPTLDAQGTLYTGSTVGHVFAIDSATGQTIFDYEAGPPVWTAPAIRPNGTLVVADYQGRVMLLGTR